MSPDSQYPAELLTLLSTKPYDRLSEDEKKWTARWMSREEYNELHQAASRIRQHEETITAGVLPVQGTKESLLAAMQGRRQNVILRLSRARVPVWQAAAVFVVTLLFGVFSRSPQINQTLAKLPDTVRVTETRLVPQYIHDTFFVEKDQGKEVHRGNANASTIPLEQQPGTSIEHVNEQISEAADVHILSLSDKSLYDNKGISLNDDTLTRQFRFVRM